VWRRARWFGNTAALLAVLTVVLLAPVAGHTRYELWVPALPFLFMLIGGVFADLLETRWRRLVLVVGLGLLAADIGFGLVRVFAQSVVG